MLKSIRIVCALIVSLLVAPGWVGAQTSEPDYVPESVAYKGRVLDADGNPVDDTLSLTVRYFGSEGNLLGSESLGAVMVADGRFTTAFGKGELVLEGYTNFRQMMEENPEVDVEIVLGGVTQSPRVTLLPGGHSPATIAALAGSMPQGPQQKGFNAKRVSTAVKAVTLQPAGAGMQANAAVGTSWTNPFEVNVSYLGKSKPVRELPTIPLDRRPDFEPEEVNRPRHGVLYDENGRRFGTGLPTSPDSLIDRSEAAGGTNPAPGLTFQFEGVGNVNGVLPPDTEGTVGPNHYIQVVNLSFAIYDKTGSGTPIAGPVNNNSLWDGFTGPCDNDNSGDAIFLYDEEADQYILTQFAVSTGEAVCFAISTTNDPTGTYHLYQLDTQRFPDYFKVGVWPVATNNAFFLTTNSGFPMQYDVYAVDRENMLQGNPARPAQFFQNFPNLFMPADVDGDAPPADSPGLLYTFLADGETYFGNPPPAEDSIDLYEFDVDWITPSNSTFTLAERFTPTMGGLAPYNWTVCGFFESDCLPQPGTSVGIDSASWWPMQRLVYRNFAEHESLVGSWTVDTGADIAAVRWFELRRAAAAGPGSGWTIHQQGTHSPDDTNRFMPSIAMDGDGNIGLGYSVTSGAVFPGIRYTAREAGDPLGTLRAEQTMIDGSGAQTSGFNRWGDYSSMELDPIDDCTFWFTTEYVETTGSAPWQTRVGAFKFPGCGGLSISPTAQSICVPDDGVYQIELLEAFEGTTDLSVGSCPGTSCMFSVNPVINPDTMSTLTVGGATAGDYDFSVTATDQGDPSNTKTVDLGLTVFDAVPTTPALTGPADGATNVDFNDVVFGWTGTGAEQYVIQIATDAGFSNLVEEETTELTAYATTLDSASTYYWRVQGANVCGDTPYSEVFSFQTRAAPGDCLPGEEQVSLFFDDLESGATGWTSSGTQDTWQLNGTRVNSGSNAYWAEDVDSVSDQQLVTPPIMLDGANPTLSFFNYQEIEDQFGGGACWDGAVLEISIVGSGTWTRLESELLTDPYDGPIGDGFDNPLSGENAWCGDPQDWLESVVDVAAWMGEEVQFRFRLATDSSVSHPGWWIDDIGVNACEATSLFESSFDNGGLSEWDSFFPMP